MLISGTPVSALEIGQLFFAVSAASRKAPSSSPGTLPATEIAILVIPSPGWKVTFTDVFSSSAGWPSCASVCDSAIEKHAACAAAMSSSGLVSDPTSSDRAAQSTSSPPIAPLETESMRPFPLIRSPCQVTSAVRSVGIRVSLKGRGHRHLGAGLDQLGERAAVVGRLRQLREGRLIHIFYTRAREKLRGDDPVRPVLDLVERDRRLHVEVL